MDEYQYPSFFEAKEKIRRYLQDQGDSGGGDCRMIKKTGGKTYKMCVQEKEDQEKVLERKFHTLSPPPAGIRLTVSQTNSPRNPDQPSTSQSQGPDNEVPSGAAKLDERIKKVEKKRVKLPTALLTFITSSGAISKYQTRFQQSLSNPVSLEVGSDLVLSSLSSDALDEAEAALQRDLTVANVKLHGATAVPSELDRLKKIMIKAKNEANRRGLRVDVSFIPMPSKTKVVKVRLVGYSEDVNKLKDVLRDYQMNQVKTKEALVKTSCQVVSKEQQGVHSPVVKNSTTSSARPRPAIRKRKTPWKIVVNKMNLEIKLGSLEDEQVNVLVVPMLNRQLTSTRIGECLLNKAGNAIKSKFDSMAANCTLTPGDVLQVDAPPSLGCSKVFFIECIPWDGVRGQSVTALRIGLKRCLDLCVQQRFCSVAFPVIGPGPVLKYPLTEAIQVLTETFRQFGLSASSGSLSTIHIIIKPNCPDSVECYHDVYKHLSSNMNQGGQDQEKVLQRKFSTISVPSGELHLNSPQSPDQSSTSQSKGPDKDVQSAAAKHDELIKKVKEKRVKLPTALLTFITSSGAISKYQTRFQHSLGNPVSLEVGSDLVLSSLSSDALDEAEATLQRDLTVANVKLHGATAVPPELDRVKEIMIKAKSKANCRELRVDVSFIPGPSGTKVIKVRLVGYSEDVNKLKDVLHDYQMNQVKTQEVLNLPHPELVDCFDQILKMIAVKQTKLTLKASHFPYPCVLVSGPRCLVKEVQADLNAALASLMSNILVLDGPGAQQYFRAEGKVSKELVESLCQVLITEQQAVKSSSTVVNQTSLEIKLGSLEDEQVNVLVVPMLNRQLTSTRIGECLLNKAGNAIKLKFDSMAAKRPLAPGDVLQVDAPPSLGCSKLFFIECIPWDGVRGQSVTALGNGLKRCLDLCVQQRFCSVAFPVIGPGPVLNYPLIKAIQVLTETIHQFGLSASSGSLSTIHIVIEPEYPDSESYHDVYTYLSSIMYQGGQAIFRSLTSDLDDIIITVGGGVQLQLVFGDITNETTDAVVNMTDFRNFQRAGVCKDILTVAGPEVEAELRAAKVKRGDIFVSQPGLFPCKALLHAYGKKDEGMIERLVIRIIELCETSGFKSVAIPAICAGADGLDPDVVAGAIFRGVRAATSYFSPYCLINIRLVLIKINVFLAFKEEAMQTFSTAVINRVSVPQLRQQPLSSVNANQSTPCATSTRRQSVFLFLGLSWKNIDNAMRKLKDLYQAQCSTKTFKNEELAGLTSRSMNHLKQLVETQGLYMEMDQSGQGGLTVSGLKDGVNQVTQLINASLHGSLKREMRAREKEDLYTRVAWCILGHDGNWERLPKTANHSLENKDIAGGIVDAQGISWSVDLQRLEATRQNYWTRQTAKLKRLVNLSDFTLPLYWDNMAEGEDLKVVTLQPSSAEYQGVEMIFKQTVFQTVIKIKRVQNVHLRRAYEAQEKHVSQKNRQERGAGEKFLFHGTSQDNCDSIIKTGFNRSFAGQNGTSCGHGTYFAVNASYSAQPTFSRPAADGTQLMFLARVLTGVYTLGQSDMKVPPPRSHLKPHNRYDSVVNRIKHPNMFVVFHDSQAYPDYLITFRQSDRVEGEGGYSRGKP